MADSGSIFTNFESSFETNENNKNLSNSESAFETNESSFKKNENNKNFSKKNETSFEIIKVLSDRGGMGDLYKVKDENGKFLVIKRVKKIYRGNKKYIELLGKEYDIPSKLNNEGIIKVFEKGKDIEEDYYSMEFIEGKTLENLMRSKDLINNNLLEKIIKDLLSTLSYIHKSQIYHRDLKPSNIMITDKGSNVKILDFGLADGDSYEDLVNKMGTKIYSSPEQQNNEEIDQRTDIYSFGIILLEILTEKTDISFLKDVKSTTYKEIIKKCTFKEKGKRFYNSDEILHFIEKLKTANKNFDEKRYYDAKKKYKSYIDENPNNKNKKFIEDKIYICKKQMGIAIIKSLIIVFTILMIINIFFIFKFFFFT